MISLITVADAEHDPGIRDNISAKIEEVSAALIILEDGSNMIELDRHASEMIDGYNADIEAGRRGRREPARRAAWQMIRSNVEDIRRGA